MDDIIEKLKEFGFNSYEAKVYLALLKKYPATGYEVAQIADIPQSRAYDSLKSLVVSKVVFSSDEKPQKYTPVAPKELTQRFKRKLNSAIDYLEKKLPDVRDDYNEPIHTITGYNNILTKVSEVINNTSRSIYLELWAVDYQQLAGVIEQAYDRGVDIRLVGYDDLSSPYGIVYQHDGAKEVEYLTGSRLVYLLSDETECVFGRIESQVAWTKNPDVAYLLKEFIVHDMYLLDVNKQFPEQLKYFYGNSFRKLKDKIVTKSSSYNL